MAIAEDLSTTTPIGSHLADVWWSSGGLKAKVSSGSGCVVTTVDGDEYLDFTSGIGATNTGHCHPRVVAAIREQAGKFIHAQLNVYRHPLVDELADALNELTPPSIDRFYFTNSGSEAVEAAVKLARQATGRPNVVVFQGGFHGRTAQAMAMSTSKLVYRAGHTPLPAGTYIAPYPYWFRTGETPEAATRRCLDALDLMFRSQTAPGETAAIVIEPIIGEGGYLMPPEGFLNGLEDVCREHGVLLVVDEIQCGGGRTGRYFAFEHFGIEPDIVIMAKGLASGFPIAAVGSTTEIVARWPAGSQGGTYGGNPIGCAAALASIDVVRSERLLENAAARGEQLLKGLREIQASTSGIGDVRGIGLMVAFELVDDNRDPDAARTAAVLSHCLDDGHLILLPCGTDGNVIRVIPPLVVTAEEIDSALAAIREAIEAHV